jgi:hypothetical protein
VAPPALIVGHLLDLGQIGPDARPFHPELAEPGGNSLSCAGCYRIRPLTPTLVEDFGQLKVCSSANSAGMRIGDRPVKYEQPIVAESLDCSVHHQNRFNAL